MKFYKNNENGRSILSKSFLSRMGQMRRCFFLKCTKGVHEEKNIKQMSRYAQETGRSILSKCGVDKQMFLSDVYKKRTQAKKHQLDAPQFGRSMVEMLGVLAIIGVLSVGGIAGYSKAMNKHKINQMLDTLSHVIAKLVELEAKKFSGEINQEHAKSLGIECEYNGYDCTLPFDFGTYFFTFSETHTEFAVRFAGDMSKDTCVAYFNSGIYKNIPEEWWSTGCITDGQGDCFYGTSDWAFAQGAKSNITSADIVRACSYCDTHCRITFMKQ